MYSVKRISGCCVALWEKFSSQSIRIRIFNPNLNKYSEQMHKTDPHFEMKHVVIILRPFLDYRNLHKADSLFHMTKLNYLPKQNAIN